MPLGHVLNRGGAKWIRIHLAVPGVGDGDVQLATVPVAGIDESPDIDPVTHVFEIEIGQRRVDGKVERGRPGQAEHPDRGRGQRSAPRPQLLEDGVEADRREQVGARNQPAATQHVRGTIRQRHDEREDPQPDQQQGVAALAPAPDRHDDPGKEGEPYERIEQGQVRDVVLALGIAPEVERRERAQGVIGDPAGNAQDGPSAEHGNAGGSIEHLRVEQRGDPERDHHHRRGEREERPR